MKLVISFAYKYLPTQMLATVDEVHDVRRFRNPHSNPALRPLDGTHPDVSAYVLSSPGVEEFIAGVIARDPNVIALGCTGGRHRSVAIAEEIARRTGCRFVHFARRYWE